MMTPYRCPSSHFDVLYPVGSIRDVCALWNLPYSNVLYHIIEDHVAATQTIDNRWIVSLPSATLFFGPPPYPDAAGRSLKIAATALQIRSGK